MTEYTKDPVLAVVGLVSRAPQEKTATSSGNKFLVFSLAVNNSYDDTIPATFYDITVFNEGLQESVKAELYKGAKVAVEGFLKQREYEGKTYYGITAHKVGLVDWLARSKGRGAPAAAATPPVLPPSVRPVATAPVQAPADDDLPF